MSTNDSALRTTIYLTPPAVRALDRVKAEHRRYGLATTISAILARLLLGETIDEVIERPYRLDLARIDAERNTLYDALRQAQARRRTDEVHRVHREAADLFSRLKQITNTLSSARRRNEPYSPDLTEATRIEESLDELMVECAEAIVPGRRR